ncbi:MAG TPA: hypothetical protein VEC19_08950 [Usitatibacter sp.]|nr:hypothetical protein [Usitatibacter sp.]
MRYLFIGAAALALSGCATTYQLSLMPRDSGKMYSGTAVENANGEGTISVTLEGKTYNGTWVQTQPARTHGFVTGGLGWGRRGFGGLGAMVTMDNPQGGEAKALLSASDGSGLRCDFKSGEGRGGGVCRDDRGKEYDVQLRPASKG